MVEHAKHWLVECRPHRNVMRSYQAFFSTASDRKLGEGLGTRLPEPSFYKNAKKIQANAILVWGEMCIIVNISLWFGSLAQSAVLG